MRENTAKKEHRKTKIRPERNVTGGGEIATTPLQVIWQTDDSVPFNVLVRSVNDLWVCPLSNYSRFH